MSEKLEEKRCIVCGKHLVDVIGNVSTCEGECREIHTRNMMKKTNMRIKKQRIAEVLLFMERKFNAGISIDELTDLLSSINIHNIPIDDFIMTSYYVVSKSNGKCGISISDIENIAVEWDAHNGSQRIEQHRKKIDDSIAKMESSLSKATNPSQLKRLENKIRRYKRLATKNPKIGYNKNAYKLLTSNIKVDFCNIHEKVKSMISKFVDSNGYEQSIEKGMIDVYESIKGDLLGKNPNVIVAGLFYFVSKQNNYAITFDEVSELSGISRPSIEDIYNTVNGMTVKTL